ncbi:MAG TPA: hypothetical protein VIG29_20985, partial [Vicinamibacteria bacterium]
MRRSSAGLLVVCFSFAARMGEATPEEGEPEEIATLREELRRLREEYEARFAAIEERIAALSGTPSTSVLEKDPAPAPSATAPTLNPQISVIGDFLGTASKDVPGLQDPSLDLREVELAFQAQLDPFARADFFVTVPSLERVEMEEGYITFLTLPSDFLVRLGKVRVPFGRANVDHRPETFTVDRPDVLVGYFGEEGLAEAGATVARLIP